MAVNNDRSIYLPNWRRALYTSYIPILYNILWRENLANPSFTVTFSLVPRSIPVEKKRLLSTGSGLGTRLGHIVSVYFMSRLQNSNPETVSESMD